jgi:hypothetical protein
MDIRERNKGYQRKYRNSHREEIRAYFASRREERNRKDRERSKNNVQFWLSTRLRSRLNRAITDNYKRGSAVNTLGCSIEQLKQHLEIQFRDGMSWSNRGTHWHIDHKKPLSSFDLTDPDQFTEACHYTNLQPLLVHENLLKGGKTPVT